MKNDTLNGHVDYAVTDLAASMALANDDSCILRHHHASHWKKTEKRVHVARVLPEWQSGSHYYYQGYCSVESGNLNL
jgi:hypothetical protein